MSGKRVFLSLGSNIGARKENLERALDALEREQIRVIARSSIYETEPQDVVEQPWFLNMTVECETRYFPLQLLAIIEKIERQMGRTPGGESPRRGPRVIDIDILLFGNVTIDTPQLVIPHPRMLERRFVLEPLLEISPQAKHTGTREPLSRYLSKVSGQKMRKFEDH